MLCVALTCGACISKQKVKTAQYGKNVTLVAVCTKHTRFVDQSIKKFSMDLHIGLEHIFIVFQLIVHKSYIEIT